jgi:hypothetical protein
VSTSIRKWFERKFKAQCQGEAYLVRFLLTPVALAILLSRLNAFFEADAVGVEERRPWHAVWNGG